MNYHYNQTSLNLKKQKQKQKKNHTPKAIAWAIPNFGTFLAHSGLK